MVEAILDGRRLEGMPPERKPAQAFTALRPVKAKFHKPAPPARSKRPATAKNHLRTAEMIEKIVIISDDAPMTSDFQRHQAMRRKGLPCIVFG